MNTILFSLSCAHPLWLGGYIPDALLDLLALMRVTFIKT